MLCPTCDKEILETVLDRYQYRECGLDSVFLLNARGFACTCGTKIAVLGDAERNANLIARKLLEKPTVWTSDEILFLKKMLRLKQEELAGLLGVDSHTLTMWELRTDKKFRILIALKVCSTHELRNVLDSVSPTWNWGELKKDMLIEIDTRQ